MVNFPHNHLRKKTTSLMSDRFLLYGNNLRQGIYEALHAVPCHTFLAKMSMVITCKKGQFYLQANTFSSDVWLNDENRSRTETTIFSCVFSYQGGSWQPNTVG